MQGSRISKTKELGGVNFVGYQKFHERLVALYRRLMNIFHPTSQVCTRGQGDNFEKEKKLNHAALLLCSGGSHDAPLHWPTISPTKSHPEYYSYLKCLKEGMRPLEFYKMKLLKPLLFLLEVHSLPQ